MSTSENVKNSKNLQLSRSIFGLILLLLLMLLSLFAFTAKGLGWFTENKRADASSLTVAAKEIGLTSKFYLVSEDGSLTALSGDELAFSDMLPGDKLHFRVVITNINEQSYIGSFHLNVPEGGEVPLIADNDGDGTDEYYYLGTQMRMMNVTSSDTDASVDAYNGGSFLMPNGGSEISSDSERAAARITVASNLTVPAKIGESNGVLTLDFYIEFANLPVSQNVYKLFGTSDAGECSKRFITADFEELN